MSDVLSMPWEELVAAVEADAAAGNARAAKVLDHLLEHEQEGGDLGCVLTRLSASPHVGRAG